MGSARRAKTKSDLDAKFVQLTVSALEQTASLFESLGFCRRPTGLNAANAGDVTGASPPSYYYLDSGAVGASLGLRLVQSDDPTGPSARQGLPTHHPGPFGIGMVTDRFDETTASFVEYGGQQLSEPEVFGTPGVDQLREVVVRMPDDYHVTVIGADAPEIGTDVSGTRIATLSIVCQDVTRSREFWRQTGWAYRTITNGVQEQWARLRSTPPDCPIVTGRFTGRAGVGVYCAALPGLGDDLLPRNSNVGTRGTLALGVCSSGMPDWTPADARRPDSNLAPWPPMARVLTFSAPDGVSIELAAGQG